MLLSFAAFGDLKITTTSTERQKRSQNLAPVLAILSGNSLVFSRKIITSTGFYRCSACCALGASAPVVVKKQAPKHLQIYGWDERRPGAFENVSVRFPGGGWQIVP